jgi:hypothetical protein
MKRDRKENLDWSSNQLSRKITRNLPVADRNRAVAIESELNVTPVLISNVDTQRSQVTLNNFCKNCVLLKKNADMLM